MSGEHTTVDGWAIVEMLGHRRVAGRISETQIAGSGFIRIDIPGEPAQTMLIAPGSVYAIHPVTEELAARLAERLRTPPVRPYELAGSAPGWYDPVDDGGALDEEDEEEPF